MSIGEKLYVYLPLRIPLAAIGNDTPDLRTVIAEPSRMEFVIRRRVVTSYMCARCIGEGVTGDLCRSPEWPAGDPVFGYEVPDEVMEWARRHVNDHVMAEQEAERRRNHG